MNLAGDVDSVLPVVRELAESLMNCQCTITAPSSAPDAAPATFDEQTGVSTPPTPDTLYQGRCRVRMPQLADRQQMSGQFQWELQDSVLSLPITAVGVDVGAAVLITASPRDPDLVDRQYEVVAVLRGSQVSARRLVIREA